MADLPRSDLPGTIGQGSPRSNEGGAGASQIEADVSVKFLPEGLYTLSFRKAVARADEGFGLTLPAVLVTAPPTSDYDPIEIVASSSATGAWIGPAGGTVVVTSPTGGGVVLITTYGARSRGELSAEVRKLDLPDDDDATTEQDAVSTDLQMSEPGNDDVACDVVMHIELQGDVRFSNEGWLGKVGGRRRVEGFSIRPRDPLSASQIEYKAFGPNGRETPWTSGGRLCGTRGRGLPLTGFAVRVVPQMSDKYDVVYEGSFFDSGVSGSCNNGAPCVAARADDPLEAMSIRVVRRAPT